VLLSMEWARTNAHRGFITSWPQLGGPAGLLLANIAVLVFSRISDDQFLVWGWRIPLMLSIVMVIIGAVATGIFGFIYFAMLNTTVPALIFIGIVLSFVPHDLMYGPQAALIAECFTPRLRYSGASIGYQLSSVISGGPAALIATALLAAY
jgi:hypothetical protein